MSPDVFYRMQESPIGDLVLTSDGAALTGLYMENQTGDRRVETDWRRAEHPFVAARAQLDAYFAGEPIVFDLPLAPTGTHFQREVWTALREIPYAGTVSYSGLAQRIGAPRATRALGRANARNPTAIIIPCHRVIGSDGSLTGFGGGIERKRFLLDLEARSGR